MTAIVSKTSTIPADHSLHTEVNALHSKPGVIAIAQSEVRDGLKEASRVQVLHIDASSVDAFVALLLRAKEDAVARMAEEG